MENDSKFIEAAKEKHEIYKKARKKAENMSKSFLDMCIKEGLTIFELKMLQDVFPRYINNKTEEILQKTKLS